MSVSLVGSFSGQVRFLKSASWFFAKALASLYESFHQVSWQDQGFNKSGFLFGQQVASKGLGKSGLASFIVPCGKSNWVLPKVEFVVKCCRKGCGSGLQARSLAQPENA